MADSAVVEALPTGITTPPPAATLALAPASAADRFLTDRRTLALFLISVVGLFLELLLIRWITTEIRIFAYLQNTVLVVCFLGLGMGCWDTKRAVRPPRHAPAARGAGGAHRDPDDAVRARARSARCWAASPIW